MVTLAVSGVHSTLVLSSRIWETLIGAVMGLAAALLIVPPAHSGAAPKRVSRLLPRSNVIPDSRLKEHPSV
jgi:hypothetical protein